MKKGIGVVIGIVIGVVMTVILIIGLLVGGWFYIEHKSKETTQNQEQKKTEKSSENKPNSTPSDKISEKAGVTLANFNKISTGMTYEKVVEILGSNGKVMLEKEIGGTKNIVYMWESERFTNITAMFVDGKLDSKNQIGLK